MKILIVSQYFYPENFKVNDIAFDFVKKGHTVTVLTGKPNYPNGKFYNGYKMFSKKEEVIKGVRIIRTPIIPRRNGNVFWLSLNYLSFVFFSFFTLRFRLRGNYDLIFSHLTSPITAAIPAIWLKRRYKAPLILWILDLWPESVEATTNIKNPLLFKFLNKLVSYIYSKSDLILVSSRSFKKSIEDKIKNKKIKIDYFPNWAEDTFTKKKQLNYVLPHLPEGYNIMFAGNIGDAQDFESIIEASKLTKNLGINWLVVGSGRKLNWLEGEIKVNSLSNIFLLGRHDLEVMPAFFQIADVMLVTLKDHPIFNLTVPAKIQAYMASGKIILGMINGEANSIINESKCGYSFPAGDYKSLANKIIELKSMKKTELKYMEKNALLFYNKTFSKNELFNELEIKFKKL
jgi:glycosyltransferase involved in cell wall biosynthesis